jgi:hypothetical protein
MLLLWSPPADAAAPDLSGTWLITYDVVTANQAPVIGAIRSTTTATLLLELKRDGDGWIQEHRICSSNVSGGLVKTRVPEAYIEATGTKRYPVRVWEADGVTHYVADLGAFTTGFDPECGPHPQDAEDPCITDWDGDGNPGATVHAKAPMFPWVEVYVAQNNQVVFTGTLHDNGNVEGSLEMKKLATTTVGASNRLFNCSPT